MSQAGWTLSSFQIFIDLSTFEQHYAWLTVTHIQVKFLHGFFFLAKSRGYCCCSLSLKIKQSLKEIMFTSRLRTFDVKGICPPLLSQNSPKIRPYLTLLFSLTLLIFQFYILTFQGAPRAEKMTLSWNF